MTTLAEFYTLVSSEIRRGTSLDTHIPKKVQQAVRWMEEQHTFRHMEHYAALTLPSTGTQPRAIAIPTGFKKMLGFRGILDDQGDGEYFDLTKIDFYDISRIETDRPSAYWQDGMDYFWLDNTPDQDYDAEMAYVGFTVLGTVTSAEPYVIQNFEGIVLDETMIRMAPLMRDPAVVGLYKPNRDEMMKSVIDTDIEGRQSWQSESAQYGWEVKERINLDQNGSLT